VCLCGKVDSTYLLDTVSCFPPFTDLIYRRFPQNHELAVVDQLTGNNGIAELERSSKLLETVFVLK
jgi:hypothetical protein